MLPPSQIEAIAKAGYAHFHGTAKRFPWEGLPEDGKQRWHSIALAILAAYEAGRPDCIPIDSASAEIAKWLADEGVGEETALRATVAFMLSDTKRDLAALPLPAPPGSLDERK